ncbi:NBAS subunit of NRZ tethering complex-like [Saccoglossus kowalevskii]
MYHHHDKSDPFGPKSYDDELFQLVLEKKIGAKIVNTPYYPALFEYLQTNQDEITRSYVEQLANQLQEAGYESEAGSLLLLYRGTHPALRTLDAALGAITKWFNK